ncbi:ABC transporter integral membrane type 1 [Penicillium maclennaniae]|uniref:ABC transporter integral membrane type 1 n=1 Tax=Penicillium maclennaniae TaxID=1343394 RepID=UPI0025410742|nr:ABC transporter integral membrane type 1 [Penicillium maclennaniae]KAJ5681901.1 ABC transporter integral membrane type 1 [Penicillium maclennaniae]
MYLRNGHQAQNTTSSRHSGTEAELEILIRLHYSTASTSPRYWNIVRSLSGLCDTTSRYITGKYFRRIHSIWRGGTGADYLRDTVTTNCIGVLGLAAAGWFLNSAYYATFVAFGELQASSIRTSVFVELLKRDVAWFESQEEGSGALLSGIQAQVYDLQTAISQPLGLVLQYACRSVASLVLGFYTSWSLSLVSLAGIPVFSSIIAYLSSRMKSSITNQQAELTHASKIASNAISSIESVKCLNGQAFEHRSFSRWIEQSAVHYLRQCRLNSLQLAFIRWMMFGMFVQGFWYGSSLARNGTLSSGEVLRTFWACLTAAQSIEMILPQMIVMEKGKVASKGLKSLLQYYSEQNVKSEIKDTLYPLHCEGDIEVNNVSFAYPTQPDRIILQPSTFFFPAGKTTFVIGKSGSGKSTLNGNSMQTLNSTWIRNNVTLVEQRSVLFNDSIFENIAFGSRKHEDIRPEDVAEPIELAMLQDTIYGLPKGIETCVGPGGSFLSGGQRQRVAIARAKLRDTPILILDEPTSALDHLNRVAVMKAIRKWRIGKTTIIITHDMSHIVDEDFVYILEDGFILHSGFRQQVEKLPGSEQYFGVAAKSNKEFVETEKMIASKALECDWDASSASSLESLEPRLPLRVHRNQHETWARHYIPPSFRSAPWDSPTTVGAPTDDDASPQRKRISFFGVQKAYVSHNKTNAGTELPVGEFVMDDIHSFGSNTDTLSHFPKSNRLSRHTFRHASCNVHPLKRRRVKKEEMTLVHILGTVMPNLTSQERIILFLGIAFSLLHASATPIFSYCMSGLFTTFYDGTNSSKLAIKWSLAVLGVSLGDGLSSFFMHFFLEYCGEAWKNALRKQAFERVLDQPRAWFEQDGNSAHRIIPCLDQNSEDMRNLVGRFAGFVIVAVAITVMAVIWSLVVCWKLTLVALACGPVIYIITRGFETINGSWERRCNEIKNTATDVFTETFSEIRTVRTLTLEGYFHRKQVMAISRCLRIGLKRAAYTGLMFALIFYYGAILAASEFTANEVMQVFSLLLFSIGYAAQILSWIPQINTSREIASQLLRLAKLPKGSHEHQGQLRVLKNVSINIAENSCTAIVGRSGSGKSTIASLLLSLYEAPVSTSGRPTVTFSGQDILHLHVPTLRSQIAIVSQQPTIFPGTIFANISYGMEKTTSLSNVSSIRAAAQAAGIDEFLISLPKGYFTVIGDGGIGLSGGQKQRVVIARALLRQPQVLILDEATSGLDPASAELVRQTVKNLISSRPGLTVIIITHSKQMIQIADHVIVLDRGVVVEDGPYRVLSQRVGGKLHELITDPGEGDS